MSVYRFDSHSPIESITTARSGGGGIRAYIFARKDADPKTLENIKHILTQQSMQWTPTTEDGQPALEVRGFGKNETSLLRLLKAHNAITDSYQQQSSIGDKVTLTSKLRKNTLQASGAFYFIGDLGFLTYGLKKSAADKKLPPVLAGIFYALGTPAMLIFGRGDKSDFQFKDMSHNAIVALEKQGIDVPKDAAIRAVANGHGQGWSRKLYNFFERYPAEITNALFGIAGTMMLWAGIHDFRKLKKNILPAGEPAKNLKALLHCAKIDIGIGIATILAGLVSVFVEEEVPKADEPRKTGVARAWQFVTDKPLRTAGILLGASTLGHAGASAIQYNNRIGEMTNKGALAGRAVFAGTNLTAEALMAVSSKGHGAGVISDRSLDRSVYAVMADLVSRSPQEKRDQLIDTLAKYLSGKKHLGGEASTVAEGIRDQLAAITQNPWRGGALLTPPLSEPRQETPSARWQTKMAAAQEAPSLSPSMM